MATSCIQWAERNGCVHSVHLIGCMGLLLYIYQHLPKNNDPVTIGKYTVHGLYGIYTTSTKNTLLRVKMLFFDKTRVEYCVVFRSCIEKPLDQVPQLVTPCICLAPKGEWFDIQRAIYQGYINNYHTNTWKTMANATYVHDNIGSSIHS